MTEKIVIENLYKIFGPNPEAAMKLLAQGMGKDEIMEKTRHGVGVADASFTVKEGEILVVMGLSGSGKSTLVRCINRLIDPTAGKVIVDGQDVTKLDKEQLRRFRLQHFGMVFQNFALFPHRTVLDNVAYGLEIQKLEPVARKKRSLEALAQVGLEGWADSYPGQLSGGMQQRVGLARALALDADVMLMDEAFSALDPLIRGDMQDELLTLQDRMQKTIVFISHDLDEALKLGDRIVLMKDARIVQAGTAEEILSHPANDYVAKFVEDVDMTKVITAERVMIKPKELAYFHTDGPKAALRKMQHSQISQIFVRKDKKLYGYVTADTAAEAAGRGDPTLEKIVNTDIETVALDTPAVEIIPLLARLPYPVPVVDEAGRLKGVIIKGSLLAGLSERGTIGNV
ncbi:quaternary amine ABC transporter ATP-binding protein [Desulfosudis oleivorans]|uniref:Glycine betaine/L-proline ABC transporter, ATPase subunit n=1 Tax=Desulfosudis oleivorans (strain DSM 6200 / JCM 39069 / Hxd3) TaxID=96561 RepID=A8ZXU1_DESOH|nr:glycine betaine/L-proline ABC transporter ATP-binding protein [Desulfosudis oleivorans]ABW68568.1 glycine betaine/L-proline ABC transporter, ATPase subunit [Desulfosudis oleivorans Hxd3]